MISPEFQEFGLARQQYRSRVVERAVHVALCSTCKSGQPCGVDALREMQERVADERLYRAAGFHKRY